MKSPKKPADKADNPEQYRRFVETARALGADESPDAMDKAFERVMKPKKAKAEPSGEMPTKKPTQ